MYLKKLREKAGLTQVQLAQGLGYTSAQFVSNWERGLALMPAGKFRHAARMFGVPVSDLINHEAKQYKNSLIKRYGSQK